MTFSTRRAKAADLPELIRLEAESFASDRLSRRSLRRLLSAPSALCLVVDGEEYLLGYALWLLRSNSQLARLYSIAVDRRSQGKGVARLLMDEGERQMQQRGCERMRLEVSINNGRAIRLYQAMSYREDGVRHEYYEDGSDALRMIKQLG